MKEKIKIIGLIIIMIFLSIILIEFNKREKNNQEKIANQECGKNNWIERYDNAGERYLVCKR